MSSVTATVDQSTSKPYSSHQKVCKFFSQGRCLQGGSCKYRHDVSTLEVKGIQLDSAESSRAKHLPKNYRTVPCKNFPLGLCNFGDTCSFIHASPPLTKQHPPLTTSSTGTVPAPRPLPPPFSDPSHTGPDWRVDISRSHTPLHQTPLQTSVPIDWTHTPTLGSTPATRSPIPVTLKFPSLSPLPGVIPFPSLATSNPNTSPEPDGESGEVESTSDAYLPLNYSDVGALRFVLGNEESDTGSTSYVGLENGVPAFPAEEISSKSGSVRLAAGITPADIQDLHQSRSNPRLMVHYKTKPCKYFSLGGCPKGEDCTFIHDHAIVPFPLKNPPIGPSHPMFRSRECKFHLAGYCHQGETCSFLHTGPAGQGEAFEEIRQPRYLVDDIPKWGSDEKYSYARPCKWFPLGKCLRGSTCSFLHDPLETRQPAPCIFFRGPGTCRNNDQCPYLHSVSMSDMNGGLDEYSSDLESDPLDPLSTTSRSSQGMEAIPLQPSDMDARVGDEDVIEDGDGDGDIYDSDEEDVIVMTAPDQSNPQLNVNHVLSI